MGGPTLALLLRDKLTKEKIDDLRRTASILADGGIIDENNDLYIDNWPFGIRFGEEYKGSIDDSWESGINSFLESKPQDEIIIDSFCKDGKCHYYLGLLCLALAKECVCIVGWLGDAGYRHSVYDNIDPKPIVWSCTYTNGTKNADGTDKILFSEYSNVALLKWIMKDASVENPPYFLK